MTLAKVKGKLYWCYGDTDKSTPSSLIKKYPSLPILYRKTYRERYRWRKREYEQAIKKITQITALREFDYAD